MDRKYPPQEEPTEPLREYGTVKDLVLWEDAWGMILRRVDSSFYAMGYRNGMRVVATGEDWTTIRTLYISKRNYSSHKVSHVGAGYKPTRRGARA